MRSERKWVLSATE